MKRVLLGLAAMLAVATQAQAQSWDITEPFTGGGTGTLAAGATTNIGFLTGLSGASSQLMVTLNDLVANTAGSDADDLRVSLHYGEGVTDAGDDPFTGGGGQDAGSTWLMLADEDVINGNDTAMAGAVGNNLDVTFNGSELKFQDNSISFAGPQTTTHGNGQIAFRPQGVNNSGGAASDHNSAQNLDPFADTFNGLDASGAWYVSITNTGTDAIQLSGVRFQGVAAVPEPTSIALFGIGIFGLATRRRKRAEIV